MDIVTIDGSSWTGKSTVAQALAKKLGYRYFPTGLLYRAAAYFLLHHHIHSEQFASALSNVSFALLIKEGKEKIVLNGVPPPDQIEQNSHVEVTSKIAEREDVRMALLEVQRKIIESEKFVIEGRDTGTVIVPSARWKFFLEARLNVKVARFFKTLPREEREKYSEEEVRRTIIAIDERDKARKVGPLRCPAEAIVYDNSESPDAEHDAMILWYYLTHHHEIIKNVELLKQWKR